MPTPPALRSQIVDQLTGAHAHVGFDRAVEGVSIETMGTLPEGMPHSIWMLTEHMRTAQHDIIDFSTNPAYAQPDWPDAYWPPKAAPSDRTQWDATLKAIAKDRQTMVELIQDPQNDLLKPIPHGSGQTLLREAILIIDHNSYHVGQIVQIRRLLGDW